MSTSMHVCYRCGLCRPPREPFLTCPNCSCLNDPERGEYETCKKCGTELPPRQLPEPIHCLLIDRVCAKPCRQGTQEPKNGVIDKCVYHTPALST